MLEGGEGEGEEGVGGHAEQLAAGVAGRAQGGDLRFGFAHAAPSPRRLLSMPVPVREGGQALGSAIGRTLKMGAGKLALHGSFTEGKDKRGGAKKDMMALPLPGGSREKIERNPNED